MTPIDTPPILIVLAAILSAAGLCVLIAGVLLACNKIGSGDLPGDELDIPPDREFSEVGPVFAALHPRPQGDGRGEGPENVGSSDLLARLPGEGSAQDPPKALECGTSVPLSLSGQIKHTGLAIICARCHAESNRFCALPNGDVVCPACHSRLILDAVFTPLE